MASEQLPQRYGKYLLLRKIAMGGMAEIFRAKSIGAKGFEKTIIIKRILPHFTDDESFVKMFIDEASIASKLQHANIVQIYDFDEAEDRYYIAMEYVEGADLKQVVERAQKVGRPLSPEQIVSVMMEIAKGLHYAHVKEYNGEPLNIVHRDMSPQNVMVSYAGEVKLMDFGIAKAAQRSTKTMVGTVKGKCAYMSPEQARGKSLDGRSDLFALGIIMWELLTQKRLFLGDSDFETLSNVLKSNPPPPSQVNPNVPQELDDIILKALAKDREERHKNVEQFQRELARWFYTNVDDLDAVTIGPYLEELFADDIKKLRQEYEEERQMTARVTGSQPQAGEAASSGVEGQQEKAQAASQPEDPQLAKTVQDGEMNRQQVEDALQQSQASAQPQPQAASQPDQSAPIGQEDATSQVAVTDQPTSVKQAAAGPSSPGAQQQATGAFPQGHTGTYSGPKKGLSGATVALIVIVALAVGAGVAVWLFVERPGSLLAGQSTESTGNAAASAAPQKKGPANATLDLQVDPPNADVRVNGEPVNGPIEGLRKGEEVHVVAEAQGYERLEKTIRVTSQDDEATLELSDSEGGEAEGETKAFVLKPTPSDAVIYVDGNERGQGLQTYEGHPGEEIEVTIERADGKASDTRTVSLPEKGTVVSLTAPKPKAELAVSVDPDDAAVSADAGDLSKRGDSWVITDLRIGDEVEVSAEKDGYEDHAETVALEEANQALSIDLDEKRQRRAQRGGGGGSAGGSGGGGGGGSAGGSGGGSSAQDSEPDGTGSLFLNARPWAKVSFDGSDKGTTPVNIEGKPVGKYKVTFTKGDQTKTRWIEVQKDEKERVVVSFD